MGTKCKTESSPDKGTPQKITPKEAQTKCEDKKDCVGFTCDKKKMECTLKTSSDEISVKNQKSSPDVILFIKNPRKTTGTGSEFNFNLDGCPPFAEIDATKFSTK